jgi:hypothetical protein
MVRWDYIVPVRVSKVSLRILFIALFGGGLIGLTRTRNWVHNYCKHSASYESNMQNHSTSAWCHLKVLFLNRCSKITCGDCSGILVGDER